MLGEIPVARALMWHDRPHPAASIALAPRRQQKAAGDGLNPSQAAEVLRKKHGSISRVRLYRPSRGNKVATSGHRGILAHRPVETLKTALQFYFRVRKRRYFRGGGSSFTKLPSPIILEMSCSLTTFSITIRTSLVREIPRSFATFSRYSSSNGMTTFLMVMVRPRAANSGLHTK